MIIANEVIISSISQHTYLSLANRKAIEMWDTFTVNDFMTDCLHNAIVFTFHYNIQTNGLISLAIGSSERNGI